MGASRLIVGVTVTVIVVVMVVSGPLVTAVDLTPHPSPTPPGRGTAAVHLQEGPHTVRLVKGAFGSGTYHLEMSPARVAVGAVYGNPLLEFVVRIPGLHVADINTYRLRRAPHHTLTLRNRPFEVSPRRVNHQSYPGTIEIRRQSNNYAVLYQAHVDVVVER